MTLLYRTVLIQERNVDRFNISGDQNRALSKRVGMQGIYFSGAYFLTWIFWYVYVVIHHSEETLTVWALTVSGLTVRSLTV